MINRVVALKNSINIILDIILRLKTRMMRLETRLAAISVRAKLENINALKEKILKVNDRINNQNETFRNATIHANANIIEMFERIKKLENQIERMN
jgi:predicted  nucleic acid-binding Zn-ribbon protein